MKLTNTTTNAVLAAISAIVLMAAVPTLIKLNSGSVIEIATVRLLIASAGLSVWLLLKKISFYNLSKRQWLSLISIGCVFAVHWFLYFKSIKLSTPSIAAITVSTYGMHLLLLSAVILKQSVTKIELLLVVIAFIGLYLVIPELHWESEFFIGAVAGILSGFLYAVLPILHRKTNSIDTNQRAWAQFFFALLVFAPWGIGESWTLSANDWLGLLALGVISTLFAHTLWIKATTELSGVVSGMLYYLYIPLAIGISILFVEEDITLAMIIGASIIVISNVLLVYSKWSGQKVV
ncbi:MAG: EamA family transporter [Gammaproteobacteria bacterium]|nr:EamA family transporter [Gammaproteobacteria bacterium]